jgi:hypothetical protein
MFPTNTYTVSSILALPWRLRERVDTQAIVVHIIVRHGNSDRRIFNTVIREEAKRICSSAGSQPEKFPPVKWMR